MYIVYVFDVVFENIVRDGFILVDNDRMEIDFVKIYVECELELDKLFEELGNELDDSVLEYLKF